MNTTIESSARAYEFRKAVAEADPLPPNQRRIKRGRLMKSATCFFKDHNYSPWYSAAQSDGLKVQARVCERCFAGEMLT